MIGFAGKNPNGGGGNSNSASRSGFSDRGNGSGPRKPRGNPFGYVYPHVDYQVFADLW